MVFKTTATVLQEMLDDFEDITGIKLSATDFGREEVIKMFPLAGGISALRAELQRVFNDFFPGSATEEGLIRHLEQRQLPDRFQPLESAGTITHTGAEGTIILTGFLITRDLDGKVYVAQEDKTIPVSGTIDVAYKSQLKGQSENIDTFPEPFTANSSLPGLDDAAVSSTAFADGRNLETPAEMLIRIEDFDLNEDTGGNLRAYENFARRASPAVTGATAVKEPRGPSTVDLIITSGTTDIRQAIEDGDAVLRIPSAGLITIVDDFVKLLNPTTDDLDTVAPVETDFDVSVDYSLIDESLRPSVDVEITREVQIFVFEGESGEILHPTILERLIDARVGHLIDERRVANFDGGVPFKQIPFGEIFKPDVITLGTIP